MNLPANLVSGDLDGDNEDDSHREFYLEYSDFQHAYLPGKYVGAKQNGIPQYGEAPTERPLGHYEKPIQVSDVNSYKYAINPPIKDDVARENPIDLVVYKGAKGNPEEGLKENECDKGIMRPCPEAITADDPGTMVVNYRNEPIGLRIMDTSSGSGKQAEGKEGNLAYALQTFKSETHDWFNNGKPLQRKYAVKNANFGSPPDDDLQHSGLHGVLNIQPKEGDRIGIGPELDNEHSTCFPRVLQAQDGSNSDVNKDPKCLTAVSSNGEDSAESVAKAGDPFTPIMRSYYGDQIRLKVQAGGDEETHNVTVHGLKWLQGGSGFGFDPNSGWRNSQQAGISEQFTFATPILPLFNKSENEKLFHIEDNKLTPHERLMKIFFEDYDVDHFRYNIFKRFWIWIKELFFEFIYSFFDPGPYLRVVEKNDELAVQKHENTDHLYTIDASTEGYWNGTWGLFRTYGKETTDLAKLPNNPGAIFDEDRMKDVCPTDADGKPKISRSFDISAVLANDVLDKPKSVTIPSQTDSLISGYLNPLGGTLVYNPRKTKIETVKIPPDPYTGEKERIIEGHEEGVIHDPTAIMYVMTQDLELKPNIPGTTQCGKRGALNLDNLGRFCTADKLRLKPEAPIEPLVLRANAGECIQVTLRNLLAKDHSDYGLDNKNAKHKIPDVLTYRQLAPIIPRNPDNPDGTVLNSNGIHTTDVVGLHPGLVAYDVTTNDGTAVGLNDASKTLAGPGEKITYRWYAGDISMTPPTKENSMQYGFVRTPVEFGGINLMPADKIKQGQKGLIGALIIEPQGATWAKDVCEDYTNEHCDLDKVDDHQGLEEMKRATRLSATVQLAGRESSFRDLVTVVQKGLTHLYGDGKPVEGLAAEDVVAEDTEDAGGFAINYGSEPLWFRYGLPPNLPLTGPLDPTAPNKITSFRNVPNAHEAYNNSLAGVSGDPAIPVLTAVAGTEFRMHVLEPAGTARGSVFNLHGHVWQRAPYICKGNNYFGLPEVCPRTGFFPTLSSFKVGSRDIGVNPLSMYLGGQDSILPASHYDIYLPKAGGENAITGDYLYKDQAGFGNLGGLWGIVRVE